MRHVHSRFVPTRVRYPLCGFVVAACCIFALPMLASAQTPSTASRAESPRPTVRVSRHELRIVFPRDTARRWGWSVPPDPNYYARRYSWRMTVDAIEGPRDVRFDVSDASFPREFTSLSDLVRTGQGRLCSNGMMETCSGTRMTGSVENGRPVLTLRDSTLISWLFALPPTLVQLCFEHPESAHCWDSVRIEYIAPSVRPLDSATRAAALRARRRESLEHFSVRRRISGGRGLINRIWLLVGDSLPLSLMETRRLEDLSMNGQRDLTDSGWVVLDPRIAQLLKPSPDAKSDREPRSGEYVAVVDYGPPRMYVKALRPGTTTIRVRGVHGLLDAALEYEVAPGVLESDLVVTRPPHRLEITPRLDTLRMGQHPAVRVRTYDAMGESTDRVPVELVCTGTNCGFYDGVHGSEVSPNGPGRMTIVARLDGLVDTLSVVVVDSAAASVRR